MANLYGVANCPGPAAYGNTIGGADIACNAGITTPIITSPPLIAPSAGYFFVLGLFSVTVGTGATPPSGLQFGLQIGSGSVSTGTGPAGVTLPASSNIYVPAFCTSFTSQVAWMGAGSTVSATLAANAQAVTVRNSGSWALFIMFRAPDQ